MKQDRFPVVLAGLLAGLTLPSCGHDGRGRFVAIDYTPQILDDGWTVSTPEEHGLDRSAIQGCYESARGLRNIYSLLIVRNGELVGEAYFNGSGVHGTNPTGWVEESWQRYSDDVYDGDILSSVRGLGYGYLWWSATSGGHRENFAWGHGGQLIFVVPDLDMVVVATARHLGLQFGEEAWRLESGVMEVVGGCIASL